MFLTELEYHVGDGRQKCAPFYPCVIYFALESSSLCLCLVSYTGLSSDYRLWWPLTTSESTPDKEAPSFCILFHQFPAILSRESSDLVMFIVVLLGWGPSESSWCVWTETFVSVFSSSISMISNVFWDLCLRPGMFTCLLILYRYFSSSFFFFFF